VALKKSGWIWFALWALPGIVVGFQVSAIGVLLLPLGLLAALILFRVTGAGPELLGILEGVAVACLLVVVLNADYWTCPPSGEVITRTRDTLTVESCGTLNPWPWLVAGLVFAVGPAIAYAVARSARTTPGST
jgi:hypothetical protein